MIGMKRPRAQDELGVSEFAAVLNGEDAAAILKALRKFAHTVRRERRVALLGSSNDESEDEADQDEELSSHNKKQKQEDWMQDTKDYNVPFVGTSIAKGDTGKVMQREWPTGFLEAYLRASPLANELIHNTYNRLHKRLQRHGQGKLSEAIQRAHLRALAEMVSAAIPLRVLELEYDVDGRKSDPKGNLPVDQTRDEDSAPRFLAVFLKERLPGLIDILQQETGHGKGTPSGVSHQAVLVLQVLYNLVQTSSSTARFVCRALDASIREGVYKILLREPRKKETPDDETGEKEQQRLELRYKVRSLAIEIVTSLLSTGDKTIISSITTMGSKDRKVFPGFLYTALRFGLQDSLFQGGPEIPSESQVEYLESLSESLRTVTSVLLGTDVISRRVQADLLGGEALQNLTHLVRYCAPSFESYGHVQENYHSQSKYNLSPLQRLGMDARRLVFLLLANRDVSPFLSRISGSEEDKISNLYASSLCKALYQLLAGDISPFETQRFIIQCMRITPLLLSSFFKGFQMPDLHKSGYTFLVRLRFLGRLLEAGPIPLQCVDRSDSNSNSRCLVDKLLSVALPQNLNKHLLSRSLQCTNPLIVAEAAKLMLVALRRSLSSQEDLMAEDFQRAFQFRLPDIHTILSTRAKFDPFLEPTKRNIIVNGLLCQLFQCLLDRLPDMVISVHYDWIKILPEDISHFRRPGPLPVLQVLTTLDKIMKCRMGESEDKQALSSKGCRVLLDITISADQQIIYDKARRMSQSLLLHFFGYKSEKKDEVSYCLQYEASLWVDGMKRELLDEFQSILEEASQNAVKNKLTMIRAWKEAGFSHELPVLQFSKILLTALCNLRDLSRTFSGLVIRVASRCLFFHSNPLPISALLAFCRIQEQGEEQIYTELQLYAGKMIRISSNPYDILMAKEIESQARKLSTLAGETYRAEAESEGVQSVILRHSLHLIALLHGFDASKVTMMQLEQRICYAVLYFLEKLDLEPLVTALKHPAISQGCLSQSLANHLELVSLSYCRFLPDDLSSGKALDSALAEINDLGVSDHSRGALYVLLKAWFYQPFAPMPGFRAIGTRLVRRAVDCCALKSKIRSVIQSLAVIWIELQEISIAEAWRAWQHYSSRLGELDTSDISLMLAVEKVLVRATGEDEALLYANIFEMGIREFLGRCLQLKGKIHSCMLLGRISSSLLTKALRIGINPLVQSIILLTASDPDSNDHRFLTSYYLIDDSTFLNVWRSGLLDEEVITVCKDAGSDLSRLSLKRTLGIISDPDRIYHILSRVTKEYHGFNLDLHMSDQEGELTSILRGLVEEQFTLRHGITIDPTNIIFECIPKALKITFRIAIEGGSSCCNDDQSSSFCASLLSQAIDALENPPLEGPEFSVVDIDSVLRSCLKHGISGHLAHYPLLRYYCLKLVRTLLALSSSSAPDTRVLTRSQARLCSNQIWSMVLSHSKFREALYTNEGIVDATLELVKLLVCCASLNANTISLEKDTLNILAASYGGGTSELDLLLKRLFCVMVDKADVDELIFADEFCRLVISGQPSSTSSNPWAFLETSLDIKRVHDTLSQFPQYSSLHANPLAFETWARNDNILEQTDIFEGIEDEIVEGLESSGEEAERRVEPAINTSDTLADTMWRGVGPDLRYDPAFIVPHVVSALDSVVTDEEESEAAAEYVRFAQRLCDRGALAILLASLCSSCKRLRKTAFAGLSLFHQAVDTEAAKNLSTWRERPQLKMLLNSVQRGFCIRKAMLSAKGMGSEVPKISSLSSIFLAKASLVLFKPGDAMYTAVNKYFLKLDHSHGAYSDMTRLPGFIPLFCSSSDDQPERERYWALACLRDSFLDPGSYQMVAACHAPDLLLTTLGRTSLDSFERLLVVQALKRLLEFGGKPATHHLVVRAGLLSWLRTFLLEVPNDVTTATLELVEIAVRQGMQHTSDQLNQLVLELRNLMTPLAELPSSKHLLHVYCVLAESLVSLKYTEAVSPCGIPVESSLRLLRSAEEEGCAERVLGAVCTAPAYFRTMHDQRFRFCQAALMLLAQLSRPLLTTTSIVMKRVKVLVEEFPLEKDEKELLRLLLTNHSLAIHAAAQEYVECLSLVVGHCNDNCSDSKECVGVAKRIIQAHDEARQSKK